MASEDRPEIAAQRNFRSHRDSLAELSLAQRFEYIHRENVWGSLDSVSGNGSSLEETGVLRAALPALFASLGVTSLLDAPCGDFGWLSSLDLPLDYTGADIVGPLIDANRARYARPGRRFLRLDLTADVLPPADLVLCRDCLVHLSYANIERALHRIEASGAKWLLTTTFLQLTENRDIEDGDWRPLRFDLAPFHFPPPEHVLIEHCPEGGGAYHDKALGLWRLPVARTA